MSMMIMSVTHWEVGEVEDGGICGKWSYKYKYDDDNDDDEEKVLVKIRISPLSGPPRGY